MVRKMAGIGFSYLIGLFLASFFNADICIYIGISVAFVTVIYMLMTKKNKHITMCVCLISFAVGSVYYGVYSSSVYSNIIKFDGYDVKIEGRIIDYYDLKGDKTIYTIKGKISGDVTAVVNCFSDSTTCKKGDYVTLTGRAYKMENSYNFPSESYYKAKGIYLNVNNPTYFSVTEDTSFSLTRTFDTYRNFILSRMKEIMNKDESAVISAILFGEKSGITSYEKTLMYRSGIGHIMAVSGVHVTIVCTFFWTILSVFPINKHLKFVLLMIPLFAFILLAGMSNSVLRSAIMIIIVYSAELFKRRADTFNSLGISIVLLTITCPFSVRDPSFLLSVGGVFGMAVVAPIIIDVIEETVNTAKNKGFDGVTFGKGYKLGKIENSIVACVCAVCILFPVSCLFFDEISIISPLSNLILVPICMLIMLCGLIVTVTGGIYVIAVPVLKFAGICCKLVLGLSEIIGKMRFAYIPVGYDFVKYVIVICIVITIIGCQIMRHKKSITLLSVGMLVFSIVVIGIYRFIPDGNINIAVLKDKDSSVMIIHDKKTASIVDLYKGGDSADLAVKYLNKLGIYRIDALYLNVNSLTSLPVYADKMKLFEVDNVLIPSEDYLSEKNSYLGKNTLNYDKNADGNKIEMPYYTINIYKNNIEVSCNNSCIALYDSSQNELAFIQNNYDVAVMYKGTNMTYMLSDKVAVMDDKTVVPVDSQTTAVIGQNVKIITYNKSDSVDMEVIKVGSCQ